MPELPEVETVVLGLKELLIGHQIHSVEINHSKSFLISQEDLDQYVLNSEIVSIERRGKAILIGLSSSYSIVIHLKMTGQLVYVRTTDQNQIIQRYGGGHPTDSFINSLPDSTTRAIFNFNNKAKLFFNDMRKFGWIKLVENNLIEKEKYIHKLGPDVLEISTSDFSKIISSRSKGIKSCLLDQSIIAGCGNIYADESLWLAKISPERSANMLSEQQLKDLHKALQEVMISSIREGGSSSKNYINVYGEKGKYLSNAHVYQKKNQPCKRCNYPIMRIVVASRGTHVCLKCQSND